jgi:hypothetical protein
MLEVRVRRGAKENRPRLLRAGGSYSILDWFDYFFFAATFFFAGAFFLVAFFIESFSLDIRFRASQKHAIVFPL